MRHFIATRMIPICDIVLALSILCACSWTLAQIFKNGVVHGAENEAEVNFLNAASSYNVSMVDESDEIQLISADTTQKPAHIQRLRVSRRYTLLLQASIGVALLGTLFQLAVSFVLLCTVPKRRRRRLRMWQLSHFLVIVILTMALLVPLSYDTLKDTFRGTRAFGHYMAKECVQLWSDLVTDESLQRLQSLLSGSNLYFALIPVHVFLAAILLLASVSLSCPCCSHHSHYSIVY